MGFFSKLFGKKKKESKQDNIKEEENKMGQVLTQKDFKEIASEFELEEALVRAIFVVEAGGKSGFLKEDPKIPVTLEEGHVFYKYAKISYFS